MSSNRLSGQMLFDGKKVACATCIKGHRATHCKHKDRPMVEIKKIGRPATQCERCRALRLVRQLHVKCNCSDEQQMKRTRTPHDSGRDRKKRAMGNLRAIAPRQNDPLNDHQQQQQVAPGQSVSATTMPSPSESCCSTRSLTSSPAIAAQDQCLPDLIPTSTSNRLSLQGSSESRSSSPTSTIRSSCCGSRPMSETRPLPPLPSLSPSFSSSYNTTPKNDPALSSTCCPSSTTQRNASGQPIRLVTCRCGDACTCIGCDAHPARAMKSYPPPSIHHHHQQQQQLQQQEQHQDPYAGYPDISLARRRLSIASICQTSSSPSPCSSPSSSSSSSSCSSGHPSLHGPYTSNSKDDQPTSVLTENGALLCGCGCSHALDQCTDCFQDLCQDYFTSR